MSNKSARILLIEDNLKYVNLFSYLMVEEETSLKIDLKNAICLELGLDYLKGKDHFDLIVLDLFLPDSRGLDSITRIQEIRPNVPIIILTALDDADTRAQALKLGAKGYLPKDQIVSKFIPILQNLLSDKGN